MLYIFSLHRDWRLKINKILIFKALFKQKIKNEFDFVSMSTTILLAFSFLFQYNICNNRKNIILLDNVINK